MKTETDQSIPHVFSRCLIKNDPQTFKSSSYKNSYSPEFISLVKIAAMNVFLLHVITEDITFHESLSFLEIILTAMLILSLKPVF